MSDYHLEDVVSNFLNNRYPERNELLRTLSNPFLDSPAIRSFIEEIADNAQQVGSQPTQVIGIALMYGMVVGIHTQKERATRPRGFDAGSAAFDVIGMVQEFLANRLPARRELMREFTERFRDSEIVQRLVIQIGWAADRNGLMPLPTIALGMRHGMAVGIMLERDRAARMLVS